MYNHHLYMYLSARFQGSQYIISPVYLATAITLSAWHLEPEYLERIYIVTLLPVI